jgi:hypothetical protein
MEPVYLPGVMIYALAIHPMLKCSLCPGLGVCSGSRSGSRQGQEWVIHTGLYP